MASKTLNKSSTLSDVTFALEPKTCNASAMSWVVILKAAPRYSVSPSTSFNVSILSLHSLPVIPISPKFWFQYETVWVEFWTLAVKLS